MAAVLAGLEVEVPVPVPVPVAGLVELVLGLVLGPVRLVAPAVELGAGLGLVELGLERQLALGSVLEPVQLVAPVLEREVLLWVGSLEVERPVLYCWSMRSGGYVESARLYFADRFG